MQHYKNDVIILYIRTYVGTLHMARSWPKTFHMNIYTYYYHIITLVGARSVALPHCWHIVCVQMTTFMHIDYNLWMLYASLCGGGMIS